MQQTNNSGKKCLPKCHKSKVCYLHYKTVKLQKPQQWSHATSRLQSETPWPECHQMSPPPLLPPNSALAGRESRNSLGDVALERTEKESVPGCVRTSWRRPSAWLSLRNHCRCMSGACHALRVCENHLHLGAVRNDCLRSAGASTAPAIRSLDALCAAWSRLGRPG